MECLLATNKTDWKALDLEFPSMELWFSILFPQNTIAIRETVDWCGNLRCVPFQIRCNSTTNPENDAKYIALERSESPLLNDVLDVVILVFQRMLWGFKQVILWLDFDFQFPTFTLSGVSVNRVRKNSMFPD
jgi:hypothetical protein